MKTSEDIKEIAKALSQFQGEISAVKQESENPYFKSKYSDLTSIWTAIRPHLHKNGLSIIQETISIDAGVSCTTRILHVSGQFIEVGPLTVFLGKKDPHSVGSCCSYAKRYSLCSSLGITSSDGVDDDDGNLAQAAGESNKSIIHHVDINEFKSKWKQKYPEIELYLDARRKYKKQSLQNTVNECAAQDVELFEKNIRTWIKKSEEQIQN